MKDLSPMIKRLLVLAAMSVLSIVTLASSAHAQTGPSGLPNPGGGIKIACSVGGGKISCTISGMKAGASFTLTLTSTPQQIASGTAAADGTASTSTPIPCGLEPGVHTVTVNGTAADGVAGSASTTIDINASAIPACAPAAGTATPLARTGSSNTTEYVGVGLAAIAAGGVLLVTTRKRRATTTT